MEPYSLQKFFKSPFPIKVLPYLLLGFALLGFFDATYLTVQHYQHAIPPCTIGGCETVLTSSFATLAGIPISLIGAGFYGVVIVITGIYITVIPAKAGIQEKAEETGSRIKSGMTSKIASAISQALFILCSLGFLVGLILIGIQAFVLHSWCYYCLFSELIDFLLFDTSWWLYNNSQNPNPKSQEHE